MNINYKIIPFIFSTFFLPLFASAAIPSANLIQNSTLESQIIATGTPDFWTTGGFGTNDRAFEYVQGVNGKAVKVTITTYTDGDAKWVPQATTTTVADQGALYSFTDEYLSTATSSIVAVYTYSNASSRFIDVATLPSTNGAWKTSGVQFSSISDPVFGAPVSITVYHVIRGVGSLTTDNYLLVESVAPSDNVFPQGIVSLTFDDGWQTQYTNGFVRMLASGIRGTFYTISNALLNSSKELFVNAQAIVDMRTTTTTNSITWSPLYTDPSSQRYFFADVYTASDVNTVHVTYSTSTPDHSATTTITSVYGPFPAGTNMPAAFTIELPVDMNPGISIAHMSATGTLIASSQSLTELSNGYFSPIQMLMMQAAGNEIAGHTANHCNIIEVSGGISTSCALLGPSQSTNITAELTGARNATIGMGATPLASFAYPYGRFDVTSKLQVESAGFTSARSLVAGYNTRTTDQFELRSQIVDASTTLTQVKSWIDTAITNKFWLVLVFHQIDNPASLSLNGEDGGTTPENFQGILDYLNTLSSGTVRTVGEAMALGVSGGNVPALPDVVPPVITLNGGSTIDLHVGDAYTELGATVTDNVQIPATLTINNNAVTMSLAGTYLVTYDAVDASGNHAIRVTRTVNVTSAPVSTGGGGGGGGGGATYYYSTIKINNSAAQSSSTNVTLTLSASGLSQMWLSNDAAFSTGTWMPIQATYPWTLTNSTGTKTVYARFGSGGSTYATNQASIVLTTLGTTSAPVAVAPISAVGTVLGTSTTMCTNMFTKTSRLGHRNDEVKNLQIFLKTKEGETLLPSTGYFGPMTRDAVKRFQTKYASIVLAPRGLTAPTGIVGPSTRAQANTLACTGK